MSDNQTQDLNSKHGVIHDPSNVAMNFSGNVKRNTDWTSLIKRSCTKLARAKTQYNLLVKSINEDIFSSVRPKVGKVFKDESLEIQKRATLISAG